MSKHSPGPWTYEKVGHRVYVVDDKQGAAIAYDIAYEADARLIAAAPELLAALKDIVRSGAIDGDMRKTDAEALIRRIEGEE